MSVNETSPVFVDWITVVEHHPGGGLPIITGGLTVKYSSSGNPVFERNHATAFRGSHDTSLMVACDGFRVLLSGNAGRFGRPDNVFGLGFADTLSVCNRVVVDLGLPAFTAIRDGGAQAEAGNVGDERRAGRGARLTRLDLTRNYATGSDSAARKYIRWLSGLSVKRMKKGSSGDESVWWSNTRHMLKAYRKGAEMRRHESGDERLIEYLEAQGVVRVEVELKRRLLSELGLQDVGQVNDQRLAEVFEEQVAPFRKFERQGEGLDLEELPRSSRVYAQAWLSGGDVRGMCSQATLYRHARVLAPYGIDLFSTRDVLQFPQRVEVIELKPLTVPDWYDWHRKEVA